MPTLKEAFESEKVVPFSDILTRRITENSFAVEFHAVLNGTADKIYNDPEIFFDLTHMTNNIKGIANDVLTRITKGGSRPLLVIDTTFGGGKTHTLVFLHHLFSSSDIAKKNVLIQSILKELKFGDIPEVSLVSIDCHDLSSVKKKGKIRTIWGQIAKKLDRYDMMEIYDQELRRPDASTLSEMIDSVEKPVLILIDELVNYLKDAKAERVGDQNLAEITVAFFHTITSVIVNSKNAMLIVTLPGTESAYKEEAEILEQYKKVVKGLSSREAAFTVPMEKTEIYEVIRKRLFDKVDESLARSVAEELQNYYAQHTEYFPDDSITPSYYEKIVRAYPFHPNLVDMLYERVSTISEFNKTRGVLRLLSHVLKDIYNNITQLPSDIVITPGIINLLDNNISQELTTKIAMGQFQEVIKTDISNEESEGKCQKLDNKKEFGSLNRIATSIYLYTLIGVTKEVSIGCSQKELIVSSSVEGITYPKDIINDLVSLENNLWYVYNKTGKWFFSVQVNINKVISDATDKVTKPQYDPEIKTRLRKMLISDFFDVHIWDHDIRNPHKPTLVVPNHNDVNGSEDKVPDMVKQIIEKEGTSFRTKKNLMYVLVARDDRIVKMIDAAKRYLAIKDIKNYAKSRDDIKTYASKIDELLKESESNLNAGIELCYSLIFYPHRTDIKCITVLDGYEGAKNLPDKIYKALSEKAKKIVEKLAPVYIVDKILQEKSELTVGEIWSTFEESPVHPLPKNKQSLFDSLSDGVDNKMFGIYMGGIGDIISITQANYQKVGENFFFNRRPSMGPRESHYVLPKIRTEKIEKKLNAFSGKVRKTPGEHEGGETELSRVKKTIAIDDVTKIIEYKDWSIKHMQFGFANVRVFPQLQSKISLLLLGIPGVKFSIDLSSEILNLSIKQTEITDFSNLMDVLFRISNMFAIGLDVLFNIKNEEEMKVDDDIARIFSELSLLGEDLKFNIKMEK